jgi:long-chain acyl-CoA synthetase
MPAYVNLGSLLSGGADPSRIALVEHGQDGGTRHWCAADLDTMTSAVARGLLRRGLRRGESIVVMSANSAKFVALYFGAMRAGIVVVPVNWKLVRDQIAHILVDSGARLAFVDDARRALLPPGIAAVAMDGQDWESLLDRGPFEAVAVEPEEIAQILYTSGSTGIPKGVPLSHAGQHWAVKVVSRENYRAHRLLIAAPMYHMNALFNLKFAFRNGAAVILLPGFDAASYARAIVEDAATWLTCVPTMLAMVANQLGDTPRPPAFDAVTRIFMGSSPYSQQLLDRVKTMFPNAAITNGYGTTEAGPAVFGPHPGGLKTPDCALGFPLLDAELRIVDAAGRVVKGAGEGVLQMRNPATMRGYRNLPERTRAALRHNGWYHSGDVVRRDPDGFLWFVGREDDMFVCGGENIWPVEMERILERHPDIAQAVVVPVPDATKQHLPVAFVVARGRRELQEADVKAWALNNAPVYQHPRRVFLVDSIPLAGTNKVDRVKLCDLAARSFQRL